jgi:hypothetical protein
MAALSDARPLMTTVNVAPVDIEDIAKVAFG